MKSFNLLCIGLSIGFLTLTPLKGLAVGEAPLSSPKEAAMAKTSAILFGIQMLNYFGTPLVRDLFAAAKANQGVSIDFLAFIRFQVEQGLPLWGYSVPSEEASPSVAVPLANPPAPLALAHHGQVEVEMPTDEHNCFFFSILAYLRVALSEEAFTQFLRQWEIYPMHPREGFVRLLTATLTDPQAPQNVRQAIRRNILLQIVNDAMGDAQHLFANQNASALAQQFQAWLLQILKGGRQFKLIEALALLKAFQALVTNNGKGLEDFLNNPNANLFLEFYLTQYLGQHVAGTDAYPMIGVTGGREIAGMAPAIVEALGQAIHHQIPMFRLWNGDCWAKYEPVGRLNIDEGTLPNLQMIHTVADPALRGQPGAIRNHFNLLASPYEAAVLRHVETGWQANLKKSKYIHGYPIDEELLIPLPECLDMDTEGNWLARILHSCVSSMQSFVVTGNIYNQPACLSTSVKIMLPLAIVEDLAGRADNPQAGISKEHLKHVTQTLNKQESFECTSFTSMQWIIPWEIYDLGSDGALHLQKKSLDTSPKTNCFLKTHPLRLYHHGGKIGILMSLPPLIEKNQATDQALHSFRELMAEWTELQLHLNKGQLHKPYAFRLGAGDSFNTAVFCHSFLDFSEKNDILNGFFLNYLIRLIWVEGREFEVSIVENKTQYLFLTLILKGKNNKNKTGDCAFLGPCKAYQFLAPQMSFTIKEKKYINEIAEKSQRYFLSTLDASRERIQKAKNIKKPELIQELAHLNQAKFLGDKRFWNMADSSLVSLCTTIMFVHTMLDGYIFSRTIKSQLTDVPEDSVIVLSPFYNSLAYTHLQIMKILEIFKIPFDGLIDDEVLNSFMMHQERFSQSFNSRKTLSIGHKPLPKKPLPKKQSVPCAPVQPRPKRQPKPKPVEESGAPSSALTSSEVEDYDLFNDDHSSHRGPTAEEKAYWRSLKKKRSTQESLEDLAEMTYALNDPQANQTQNILWALPDNVRDAFVDYLAENDLDAHERLQNLSNPQNNSLTEVELDDAILVIAPALASFLRQLTFTVDAPAPKPQPKGTRGKQVQKPVRAPEPIRYYSDAAIRLFMARLVVDWYAHFHKWHSGKSGHNEQHVHRSWIAARQGPLGLRNLMDPSHNAIMGHNHRKNMQRQLLGETLGAGAQARAITGASEVLRLANERRGGQGIVGLLSFLQGTEVAIQEAPAPIEEEVPQPAQPNKKPNPQPKRKRK